MIAVLQRVRSASVVIEARSVSRIGDGLLALVGVRNDDGDHDADFLARKIPRLRIFADRQGKMNRSLIETGGELLLVSQFTLLADARRGRRPSFTAAMAPAGAEPLLERLAAGARQMGVAVSTGVFGASMQVSLVNDGPVTILLDSRESIAAGGDA